MIRVLLLFIPVICLPLCVWNQSLSDPFFSELSIERGEVLASDNYRVVPDFKGFVWICSPYGLIKSSGTKNLKFTTKNGLPSNDVFNVIPDKKGRTWLQINRAGLWYIQNDKVFRVPNTEGIQNATFLREDKAGIRFTSFVNGILTEYIFNYKAKRKRLRSTKNDYILLANSNLGQCLFEKKGRDVVVKEKNNFKHYKIESDWLTYVRSGKLIISDKTSNGCFLLEGNKLITLPTLLDGKLVKKYSFTDCGDLIIEFTDSKVQIYTNFSQRKRDFVFERVVNYFNQSLNLYDYFLTSSKYGGYWMTMKRGAVYFASSMPSNLTVIKIPVEIRNPVTNFFKIGDNWFFTSLIGNNIRLFNSSGKNFQNFGLAIVQDGSFLWSKSFGDSLVLFEGLTQSYQVLSKPLKDFREANLGLFCFNDQELIDSRGQLYLKNPLKRSTIRKKIQLVIPKVKFLQCHKKGMVYGNSSNIVFQYQKKIVQFPLDVLDIAIIHNGIVAVATNGNGLKFYSQDGKLLGSFYANSVVNSLAFDGSNLYVIVENQIKLIHCIWPSYSHVPPSMWIENDISHLFSGSNDQLLKIKRIENNLAVCSRSSIKLIDIKLINQKNKPFKHDLVFRNFEVNGSKKNFQLNIKEEQSVKIMVDGFCFGNQQKRKLHLDVYRNDRLIFQTDAKNGIFELPFIKQGTYTLKCSLMFGNSTLESITLPSITVSKMWYNSFWFYASIFMFLFGLVYFSTNKLYRQRIKRLRRERESFSLYLRSLRSQLNPHFIFNALNSLQHQILFAPKSESIAYLNAFSKLLRSSLQNSNTDLITLEEEIDFITHYMELEKGRLNHGFDYQISCDPELDTSAVKVLNMTLQPIVENCILHAFDFNCNKPYLIKMDFKREGNLLVCKVVDNGMGRIASDSQQQKRGKLYHSLSSKILKERLDILNKKGLMKAGMEIRDLYDLEQPIGTEVELWIEIV